MIPNFLSCEIKSLATLPESTCVDLPQRSHWKSNEADLKTSFELKVCSLPHSGLPHRKVNLGFCLQKTSMYLSMEHTFLTHSNRNVGRMIPMAEYCETEYEI